MSKLVKTYSSALVSLDALLVTVELSVSKGFNISMVGLPDAAVRESLSRVYTACDSSGAHPKSYKTVINLSPGDVRKEGTVFDLPRTFHPLMQFLKNDVFDDFIGCLIV